MATGSGKTTVMAMLIAWQAVNAARRKDSKDFSDAFLIVTPGITIRDRLRVLLPSDPDNYYETRDIVPPDMLDGSAGAEIVITNYHAFSIARRSRLPKLARSFLAGQDRAERRHRDRRRDDGASLRRASWTANERHRPQ